MSASHIATYTARIGNTSVAPTTFDVPLILVYTTAFPEDVKTYTGDQSSILAAMVADGLVSGSPAHTMASRLLEQPFKPRTIKVGRLSAAHAQSVTLTPLNVTSESVYSLAITLNGVTETATFTADTTPTAAEIATGLTSAVNAFTTVGVTATDNTGSLDLDVDSAGDVFSMTFTVNGKVGRPGDMDLIDNTTAPAGLSARMDAIFAADSSFTYFMSDLDSVAIATILASWASTNNKVYCPNTSDGNAEDTGTSTDIASVIDAANNNYCMPVWDAKYNGYLSCATIGSFAPRTPGSATISFKILTNTTTGGLTQTEYNNLDTKGYLTYRPVSSSLASTFGGKVGGTYVRVENTVGIEWLKARSQEAIVNLLLGTPKNPMTEAGLNAIRDALIANVINPAITNGLLAPGDPTNEAEDPTPKIILPRLSDLSASDRANGIVRGLALTGRFAGSTQRIFGNIVVNF